MRPHILTPSNIFWKYFAIYSCGSVFKTCGQAFQACSRTVEHSAARSNSELSLKYSNQPQYTTNNDIYFVGV